MPAVLPPMAWRLFGSIRIAALASLMWVAMPLVAGAALVSPDTPLVVFWTLASAALVEVWRTRRAVWWLAARRRSRPRLAVEIHRRVFRRRGRAGAVATPSLRRWRASGAPYAAAALALAIFAPFLVWNAEHDWATFAKQLGRMPAHGFSPQYLVEFAFRRSA